MPGVQLGDAAVKARSAALLPERHLGLIAAHELGDALQRLDAAADALAQTPLGQRAWVGRRPALAGRTGAWTLLRRTLAP
jgi:cobyrinic acid a,c-diamide synthase